MSGVEDAVRYAARFREDQKLRKPITTRAAARARELGAAVRHRLSGDSLEDLIAGALIEFAEAEIRIRGDSHEQEIANAVQGAVDRVVRAARETADLAIKRVSRG